MGYFLVGEMLKNLFFESTHIVEQLYFSMFPSILTIDFDLILGSFLTFWGPNGPFLGLGYGSKTALGSPHID